MEQPRTRPSAPYSYSYSSTSSSKRSPTPGPPTERSSIDMNSTDESDTRRRRSKRHSVAYTDYSYGSSGRDTSRSSRSTDHSRERPVSFSGEMYWEQGAEPAPERKPEPQEKKRDRRRRERSRTVGELDMNGIRSRTGSGEAPPAVPKETLLALPSPPPKQPKEVMKEVFRAAAGALSPKAAAPEKQASPAVPGALPVSPPTSPPALLASPQIEEPIKELPPADAPPPLKPALKTSSPAPSVGSSNSGPTHSVKFAAPPLSTPAPKAESKTEEKPSKSEPEGPSNPTLPKLETPRQPPRLASPDPPAPHITQNILNSSTRSRPTSPTRTRKEAPGVRFSTDHLMNTASTPSPTDYFQNLDAQFGGELRPWQSRQPTPGPATQSSELPPEQPYPSSTFVSPPAPKTRRRQQRPHSFSASLPLLYNTVQDDDQPTPRGKPPPGRPLSMGYHSHEYPPPAYPQYTSSTGMYPVHPEYPAQQEYHQPPAHPTQPEYSYQPVQHQQPQQFQTAQDPFHYIDSTAPAAPKPRRSRRRSSVNGVKEDLALPKVLGEETDASDGISWPSHSRDPSMSRAEGPRISAIPEEETTEQPKPPAQREPEPESQHPLSMPPWPEPAAPSTPPKAPAELPLTPPETPQKHSTPPQLYRRFTSLNTHVLQHLQAELTDLESSLAQLDAHPDPLVVAQQRPFLLNTIAWKLEAYNRGVSAYSATLSLPAPSVAEVQESPRAGDDPRELFTFRADAGRPAEKRSAAATQAPAAAVVSTAPPASQAPTYLQLLTILAILIAPLLRDSLSVDAAEEADGHIPVRWESVALRIAMWVLALAATVVEVVKGKGWFSFGVLVVGLGSVLGLLTGS